MLLTKKKLGPKISKGLSINYVTSLGEERGVKAIVTICHEGGMEGYTLRNVTPLSIRKTKTKTYISSIIIISSLPLAPLDFFKEGGGSEKVSRNYWGWSKLTSCSCHEREWEVVKKSRNWRHVIYGQPQSNQIGYLDHIESIILFTKIWKFS